MHATHEVLNQPDPLVNYNLFAGNRALQSALKFNAPALDTASLQALGAQLGTAEMQNHARLANVHTPLLRSHSRFGHRIDQVEFHPSYHALMSAAVGAGLHGTPFSPEQQASGHAHMLRAAGFMLFTELEPSMLCPISMTYAVTPALRSNAARVVEAINAVPGLSTTPVEATYLAWIDCRDWLAAKGIDNAARHFEQAGVGLSDGKDFGLPGFVRLNFGCPAARLE